MTLYASKATPPPPRHRAAPRLIPQAILHLVLLLGVTSAFIPQPYSRVLGALALAIGAAYFIQKWRRAGWDLAQNVTQELSR